MGLKPRGVFERSAGTGEAATSAASRARRKAPRPRRGARRAKARRRAAQKRARRPPPSQAREAAAKTAAAKKPTARGRRAANGAASTGAPEPRRAGRPQGRRRGRRPSASRWRSSPARWSSSRSQLWLALAPRSSRSPCSWPGSASLLPVLRRDRPHRRGRPALRRAAHHPGPGGRRDQPGRHRRARGLAVARLPLGERRQRRVLRHGRDRRPAAGGVLRHRRPCPQLGDAAAGC